MPHSPGWPRRDADHLLLDSATMAALEEQLFASGLPVASLMEKAALAVSRQLLEQRREHLVREDEVASLGRVARDVAERPNSLLAHVIVRRHEELHEIGHRAVGDHHARVLRRARGNVRERPSRLELEHRIVGALQELHEARYHARRDHLRDWRRALDAEQLAELSDRGQLVIGVIRVYTLDELGGVGLEPGL